MKTAIIYYSKHHGNTKKVLDAFGSIDESLVLIDVLEKQNIDLNQYDRIGIASGIYFNKFAKQVIEYIDKYLPNNKEVFYVYTCGSPFGGSLRSVRRITKRRHSKEIGKFHCRGFDTYVNRKHGGIAKGRPNEKILLMP